MTAHVRAEPSNPCYEIPELIQFPNTLTEYNPELFSPDGKHILFTKKDEKVLLKLDNLQTESLGKIENTTLSADGKNLSYEVTGSEPEIRIRELNTGAEKKIPEKDICGHRLSNESVEAKILTCTGEFKTYNLESNPPRLVSTKKAPIILTSSKMHFNLDTRSSFLISQSEDPQAPSTIHVIDFKNEKVYTTETILPTYYDPLTYIQKLNAPNDSSEHQYEVARNFPSKGGITLSKDGRTTLIWNKDGTALSFQLDQGKTKVYSHKGPYPMSYALSPSGRFTLSEKAGSSSKSHDGIIDSTVSNSKFKIHFNHFTFAEDDSSFAYTTPDQKEIRILNLSTGKEIKIPRTAPTPQSSGMREIDSIFFNSDSSQLLFYHETSGQPTLTFYNKNTGKLEKHLELDRLTYYRDNRLFIDGGRKLIIGNATSALHGSTDSINLETGEVERLESSVPQSKNPLVLWPYSEFRNTLLRNRLICPPSIPHSKPNTTPPCSTQSQLPEIPQLSQLKSELSLIDSSIDLNQVESECKNSRRRKSLSQPLIKKIQARLSQLNQNSAHLPSKDELNALLLAIQDSSIPLHLESTLSLLHSAVDSGFLESRPGLIQNVLIRVFDENKWLYFKFLEKHNLGSTIPNSLDSSCFTEKKIESMKNNLIAYLTHASSIPIPFSRIDGLQPIASLFQSFSKDELDHSFEELGLAVAKSTQPKYPGLMTSTLYYFISPAIREKLLKKPVPHYTEFSLLEENKKLIPVALSTGEIDSDKNFQTPHGFHLKTLDLPDLPKNENDEINKNYHWKTGKNELTAHVSLKQVPAHQLFPPRKGPDYPSLWKDQALTGLILLGSNLGRDAPILGEEYLRYFKDQGFTFNLLPEKITSVENFLKQKVSSGELDYLIKEAHSGGVRLDLVNVINQSELRVGTRELPDGKIEKIYILLPTPEGSSRTISTSDFGSWIRERERKGQGELVYFNTSCFSGDRAASDVAAASSSKLLLIPVHPRLTASFFNNRPNSAIYQLLNSIRNEKDFQGFRDNLNQVPDYQKKTQNVYIMPDEPDYQDKIINKLNEFPIHARIQIQDQNGNEIHFDPLNSISKKKETNE